MGENVDYDFEKDQQNQKQGRLFELKSDKRPDDDRDVHDKDSFVGLKKKVLEGNSLVFFIPYEVVSVRNPVAGKETECSREKGRKGREVAPEKCEDKNTMSEGEHAEMNTEEQDGARFLSHGHGFSAAVQFRFRVCPFGFGHL
jgi:hypothetical protein